MYRLAVIIPGYNTKDEWWTRCVHSVLSRCGGNDCVVCVDDGSTRRPKVLDSLALLDSRVKPIYLDNNYGQAYARNFALKHIDSEFITFVDSDDEVTGGIGDGGIYDICLSKLKCYSADIAVFGVKTIWVKEKLFKIDLPMEDLNSIVTPEILKELYRRCVFEYPVNKIYRYRFLCNHKICFDDNICPGEDTMFNIRCVLAGAKWVAVNDCGYIYYRYYGTSLSRYLPGYLMSRVALEDLWQSYLDKYPSARMLFPNHGRLSNAAKVKLEWDNMWRQGSPKTNLCRWRYLLRNRQHLAGNLVIVEFIKMFMSSFARKKLRFSFVNRWRIRHRYPQVKYT